MADLSQIIGDAVTLLEAQRTALLQETVTARTAINSAVEGLSAFEKGIAHLVAEQTRQTNQAKRAEKARAEKALKDEAERLAALEKKHTAVAQAKAQREQEEAEAERFLKSKGTKSK
jgi:hypothetical protein